MTRSRGQGTTAGCPEEEVVDVGVKEEEEEEEEEENE